MERPDRSPIEIPEILKNYVKEKRLEVHLGKDLQNI